MIITKKALHRTFVSAGHGRNTGSPVSGRDGTGNGRSFAPRGRQSSQSQDVSASSTFQTELRNSNNTLNLSEPQSRPYLGRGPAGHLTILNTQINMYSLGTKRRPKIEGQLVRL
jgi:hypothetical protein